MQEGVTLRCHCLACMLLGTDDVNNYFEFKSRDLFEIKFESASEKLKGLPHRYAPNTGTLCLRFETSLVKVRRTISRLTNASVMLSCV